MATQQNGIDLSFVAGADLSALQYTGVKINSSGQVVAAGLGELAVGILQNKPLSGQIATVRVFGVSKVKAGGTITAGDRLKFGAGGTALVAAAATVNTSDAGATNDPVIGSHTFGLASVSGVANDIITVIILHAGAVPTTAA